MHYHIREGKHNITPEDWKHCFDFANRGLAKPLKTLAVISSIILVNSDPKATSHGIQNASS